MRIKSIAAMIIALLIWSATFVVIKGVVKEASPTTIILLRFLLAYLVMLPFVLRKGFNWKLTFKPKFLIFGLMGIVLPSALQNYGLKYASASDAALLYALFPAMVALFSARVLKEKFPMRKIAGMSLAIVGVLVITANDILQLKITSLLGDGLLLAAVVTWAYFTVMGRQLNMEYDPLVVTHTGFGSALLFLVPLTAVEVGLTSLPHFTWGGILGIVFLGVGGSALAYTLWNFALGHVEASVAGTFSNLQPVFGVILAVIAGESLGWTQVVGGVIAILGVWLCEGGQNEDLQKGTKTNHVDIVPDSLEEG